MFKSDDAGKLILRLSVGILILLHGLYKLSHGINDVVSMVTAHGLPFFLAYLVFVGEIIAPLLLIFGLYARLGGVIIAINMALPIALANNSQLFSLTRQGGWIWELQGLFFCTGLAIFFLGAGRFSVAGSSARWN
jgi:putative oxidoreductase